MLNFAAIDFETANREPCSVCSVGVVLVEDGEFVDELYCLIRPEPNYYNYVNTQVHGLTRADTDEADDFPTVWRQVSDLISGFPLVAHNSTFDERCLKAVFRRYQLSYPGYEFHCTCRASRRVFGHELPNHRLDTVAARCGFDLINHHNALSDAEACAWIAREIL